MTGWEVARRLREDLMLTGAIIMISADAAEQPSTDPETCDHDDYVVKPVEVADLLAKIGRACGLTWTHEGDGSPATRSTRGNAATSAMPSPVAAPASPLPSFPLPFSGLPSPTAAAALPSRAELETLASLARIGYVRALAAKIAEIAERSPQARPYLARLSALVADVDLDTFLSDVETALDEHADAEDLA
jgi:CheY-like chemotaxis protein